MHETIMRFPSDKLYESKLKAAESVATHLLKDFPNLTRRDTDGIADPVLLIDSKFSTARLKFLLARTFSRQKEDRHV
jgi:superfamily I DNA and/or RNA helicase